MKTATYIWQSPRNPKTRIWAKVTLKDDGKISISMPGVRYGTSAADRYQAKALGQQIAAADFKHEAVESFDEATRPDGLVIILTEKTQDLKESFIQRTKDYAKRNFDDCVEKNKRTEQEWLTAYSIPFTVIEKYGRKDYCDLKPTKRYYEMKNVKTKISDIVRGGYEKYESGLVKNAEHHYESSIVKLAYRLNQKGIIDSSKFVVTTAKIGVNLEITIKHGDETTRAFTIWAEGMINAPHYRYLVK